MASQMTPRGAIACVPAVASGSVAELNALPHFKRLLPSKDYGSFRPGINHRAGVFIDDESRTARIVAVGARENFYRRFLPP
ncbi:MAG: hypothetical protein HZA67_00585 [Rhodospirillales bacterium]|nr:hypothetical protein [Rhodospirillales bacterium]